MKTSLRNPVGRQRFLVVGTALCLCFVPAMGSVAGAQQAKNAPATAGLTGHYEGHAKNKAEEVIPVTLELTDKEGALSGMIKSSHGDFPITGGSRKGETVMVEFDAGGPVGTLSLKLTDDRLAGTWSAGEDGGSVDVKKVATAEGGTKGQS